MTWTPSKLIARLGKEINNESSYLYWAYKARMREQAYIFSKLCYSLYFVPDSSLHPSSFFHHYTVVCLYFL